MTRRELKIAQDAARPKEPSPIECLDKIEKLQAELNLMNDAGTYTMLCVSSFFFLLSIL